MSKRIGELRWVPRNYADSAVAHLTPHDRPLVIVDRSPLPAVTGGRQRLWNFLLAIDSLGPADLVVLEVSATNYIGGKGRQVFQATFRCAWFRR